MASKFWPAFIPEKANCIIQIPSSLIVKQVDLFCIGELSFTSFKRFFYFEKVSKYVQNSTVKFLILTISTTNPYKITQLYNVKYSNI